MGPEEWDCRRKNGLKKKFVLNQDILLFYYYYGKNIVLELIINVFQFYIVS